MNVNSTQLKRGNWMRTNISAILLMVVSGTLLSAAILWGQGQAATNVGEDAEKYNGAPGVPIHPDQKLELTMKIHQPFTVVAVGDLLEFQPFSKSNDPNVQYLVNLTRSADLTIGD